MSEDKTQHEHEEQQELDFQEAKEMTVGEAVRKDAEIKAGVTDSDSVLDKYIKQHREEVASQKFVNQVEADGDTSPLDDFIRKQRQELAESGLIDESLARETETTSPVSPVTEPATEVESEIPLPPASEIVEVESPEVTPVTFSIGQTDDVYAVDNSLQEQELSVPPQVTPVAEEAPVQEPIESSETVITSTNADRFITSEVEQLDLGETLVASAVQPEEPTFYKGPLVEGVDMDRTVDLSEAVASVTDTLDNVAGENGETPVFSNTAETASQAVADDERIAHHTVAGQYDPDKADLPIYRRKGVIIGTLAVLALAIAGGGYAFYQGTRSASTTPSSSSSTASSSSSNTAAADNKAFEDMYKNFFTDDEQTKLANDQFDKLSDLEKLLKKLEKTNYYEAAKAKYDSLKQQIEAVQKVNSLYESDALVDGDYNSSIAVKSDANFNDLPETVTTTGNASLDSTIQSAIQGGKSQLEEKAKAASATSAATASASAAAAAPASPATPANGNTGSGTSGSTGSAATPSPAPSTGGSSVLVTRGITNYNPSTLQRDKSRVPYNPTAVADVNNPAWVWGDGVLDKIIATSHSRGYFSGDNFILEPVNIVNGNGYYNMYLPDGTYLFSINCKTGYFVGNGSGHSDKLDY